MKLLFTTRENNLISKTIRDVLDEPVSHCAVQVGRFVIHSAFIKGVHIEPFSLFIERNKIVHSLSIGRIAGFDSFLYNNVGKPYDYLGFLMLGIRRLLPRFCTKKVNVHQITGTFMCHELLNQLVAGEERTLLTPYKLYLRLLKEKNNGRD